MDCAKYIADFLSSHADAELSVADLAACEAHVSGCARCAAALASECALKASIRKVASTQIPAQVRGSILAALDAADREEAAAAPAIRARRGARRMRWAAAISLPLAAAAAVIIMVISRPKPVHAISAFDTAIGRYERFEKSFDPNVPSMSAGDISAAYLTHRMPGYLWNFQPAGYQIVGGRIEQLPNGSLATYTFYRGAPGSILCTVMHASAVYLPGAPREDVSTHQYFSYQGYTICLSRYGREDFICILVSRHSIKDFEREVVAASM